MEGHAKLECAMLCMIILYDRFASPKKSKEILYNQNNTCIQRLNVMSPLAVSLYTEC